MGPLDVFRNHFATTWQAAAPLESVIAEQAILLAGPDANVHAVSQALRDRSLLYRLAVGLGGKRGRKRRVSSVPEDNALF